MAANSSAFANPQQPVLLASALRANPELELVLFDRLPEEERRLLAGLARDRDHYGVLRPRRPGSRLGRKAVDRETALLFLTLEQPGPLPAYVRSGLGDDAARRALALLVADGVLEIELEAGRFVSGAAALAAMDALGGPPAGAGCPAAGGPGGAAGGEAAAAARPGLDRLAELSRGALRYGQELARLLPGLDPLRLSLRLYGFNRRPLTPRWRRDLPGGEAVRRFLGIASGGTTSQLLEDRWLEIPADGTGGWLQWQARAETAAGAPAAAGAAATYKLYVSPLPEALPDCFGRIVDGLAAAGAPSFKVGGEAGGLLRPDKIVAYLPSFESLFAAAAAVGERLAGTAAQGVPFTSEIAGGGLLSWGVDPPPAAAAPGWPVGGGTSWRRWLTDRLARALLSAATAEAGDGVGRLAGDVGEAPPRLEPWHCALARLRLEDIDTDSWTPGGRLWRQPAPEAGR
jgi:hypothetical protein